MKSRDSLLRKLDNPPGALNWVRYNDQDPVKMAKSIARFVLGVPEISFIPGNRIIRDKITLDIDLGTAVSAARSSGRPISRPYVEDFVRAFFLFNQRRGYSKFSSIEEQECCFHVSRNIRVPVKPTAVVIEDGKFLPVFVCGWTKNPLNQFQRRLLMSIYEDALFSLTDYRNSPGEVVFFPKDEKCDGKFDGTQRKAEVWRRGDYAPLSEAELNDQTELFMLARNMARPIIEKKLSEIERKEKKPEGEAQKPGSGQGELFE